LDELDAFPLVAGADEAGVDALLVGTEAEDTELLVDLVFGMYLLTDFFVLDAFELVAGTDEALVVFTGADEAGVLALELTLEVADEAAELLVDLVLGMYLETEDFLLTEADEAPVVFTGAEDTGVLALELTLEVATELVADEAAELFVDLVLGMYLETEDFLLTEADEAPVVFTGAEDTGVLALELTLEEEAAELLAELFVDLVLGMYFDTDFLVDDTFADEADEAPVVFTGAEEKGVLALELTLEEEAAELVADEAAELLVDLVLGMYLETDFFVLDALELVAGADEAPVVFTGALDTGELETTDLVEAAELVVAGLLTDEELEVAGLLAEEAVGLLTDEVVFFVGGWG